MKGLMLSNCLNGNTDLPGSLIIMKDPIKADRCNDC